MDNCWESIHLYCFPTFIKAKSIVRVVFVSKMPVAWKNNLLSHVRINPVLAMALLSCCFVVI
jgi:hypothetical protein